MTDSLQNVLGTPSNHYSIFERNQVLDSEQLNSLAAYLNYQEHLTRVKLLGVGIVGGLQVLAADNTVTVRQGVGVTTDGDVLTMPADTVFRHFKPYGPASPHYAPFYEGETMRPVFELVRDATSEPLSSLPVKLEKMLVVMLMERYADDPDLCSGTDCDNLGQTAFDTPRVLLIASDDAGDLLKGVKTIGQAALTLPALPAARPLISKSMTSTGALAKVYRQSCTSIFKTLTDSFGKLHDLVPSLTGDFVVATWTSKLKDHQLQFSGNNDAGIQYYYDFLKDVVDTWNELREVLLADDSALCPDVKAFPRHLVLGDLTNPAQSRTGLFPSPLIGGQSGKHGHARFLIRKLEALIVGFKLPSSQEIRVTPSRTEAESLEERAIPYYYDPAAIQHVWNYRLTRRDAAKDIYGYHTSGPDVFGRQIGRYDFFRVEGHFDQDVTFAKTEIEKAIADHNLPFTVRAVLLHTDRKKLVIRPPIRYGDLHRFHHLLRKDLSLQLAETKAFNGKFKLQIDDAVRLKSIPGQFGELAGQSAQVNSAAAQAEPSLAKRTFSEYQQSRQVQDWREGFKSVVNVANNFKGTLGDVTRNNYSTAFDSLLTNNHPAWLEWVESLIQSKDDQEDNKLLFPKFCEQHPGLEHFGGVIRGGTLVLVYNDQARVVADFMLSYNWAETAEEEPSEPEQLPDPVYKHPDLFDLSIKVLPPLDLKFERELQNFETKFQGKVRDQVLVQKDQIQFLVDVGKSIAGKTAVANPRLEIENPLLRSLMEEVDHKQQLVEELRGLIIDPATPADIREKSKVEAGRVETELAASIASSSKFLDKANIGMEAGGDGGKAIAVIARGMEKVSGPKALESLKKVGDKVESAPLKQVFQLKGL